MQINIKVDEKINLNLNLRNCIVLSWRTAIIIFIKKT